MRKSVVRGLLLTLIGGVGMGGCKTEEMKRGEPIFIGYIADTSDVATTQARTAVLLAALRRINEEGGVEIDGTSHDLDLLVVDHAHSLEGVATALELLEERGVTAAVDPNWSSLVLGEEEDHSDGAALLARDREIVLVSGSTSAAAITDLPDEGYFSRTAPSDAIQGVVGAEALISQGITTAAVLFRADAWGTALSETFVQAFEEQGGTVLATQSYDPDSDFSNYDFSTELIGVFADQPEAIYVATFDEFFSIAAQTSAGGYLDQYPEGPPLFFGADGIYSEALVTNVPEELLPQIQGTVGGSDRTTEAWDALREMVGDSVSEENLDGPRFDAIYLLALAIQAGESTDGRSIRDLLGPVSRHDEGDVDVVIGDWREAKEALLSGQGINLLGATGEIELNAAGDRTEGVVTVWKVEASGDGFVVDDSTFVSYEL